MLLIAEPIGEQGAALSAAGDINGDGLGQVNVYLGSASGITGGPIAQVPGPVAGGNFGAAVA